MGVGRCKHKNVTVTGAAEGPAGSTWLPGHLPGQHKPGDQGRVGREARRTGAGLTWPQGSSRLMPNLTVPRPGLQWAAPRCKVGRAGPGARWTRGPGRDEGHPGPQGDLCSQGSSALHGSAPATSGHLCRNKGRDRAPPTACAARQLLPQASAGSVATHHHPFSGPESTPVLPMPLHAPKSLI